MGESVFENVSNPTSMLYNYIQVLKVCSLIEQ